MNQRPAIMAAVEGEEIVLHIPIETLCWAIELGNGNDPGVKITDRAAFAKWVADKIVNHDPDAIGNTALGRLLDSMANDAVEWAKPFVAEPHLENNV